MANKIHTSRWVRGALAGSLLTACFVSIVASSTPAEAATCGVQVTRGEWDNPGGAVHAKPWTWKYHNCAHETEHERVDVAYGPDSKCFSIGAGGTATFSANEVYPPHANYYRKTVGC
jgi:hypothetical protein